MSDRAPPNGDIAFALVYLTFFLDNVLLTVLVPIIPDWVRGGAALEQWARHDAPLAAILNHTLLAANDSPGWGAAQASVGLVLGAKAAAQLVVAPLAAGAAAARGPRALLAAATAALAVAALTLAGCGAWCGRGWCGAACAGLARAAQGAGAAGAAVGGLALAAQAVPPRRRDQRLSALLGAVALGVLVGYPFGGLASAWWSRPTPFLLIALALLVDLAMQNIFLDKEEYNRCSAGRGGWAAAGLRGVGAAARGAGRACAGAVLLTTAVVAALEPCLPLWLAHTFRVQRWQAGAAFVADSAGYLAATSAAGGLARRLGAERFALAAQALLGVAAIALPAAPSVWWVWVPQLCVGLGLGGTDGALVPALAARRPRRLPHVAALLQAAAAVAYTLGPVLGGLMSWAVGFPATLRALGALNLLYTLVLYRALRADPLSEQWGASPPDEDDDDDEDLPLSPGEYVTLQ